MKQEDKKQEEEELDTERYIQEELAKKLNNSQYKDEL